MIESELVRILRAVLVAFLVVLVAGFAVEVVRWIGLIEGLGLHDQIARSIADSSVFVVSGWTAFHVYRIGTPTV